MADINIVASLRAQVDSYRDRIVEISADADLLFAAIEEITRLREKIALSIEAYDQHTGAEPSTSILDQAMEDLRALLADGGGNGR